MSFQHTTIYVQSENSSQITDEQLEPDIDTACCHQTQYDMYCEMGLKSMIANLLDKAVVEATAQVQPIQKSF